MDTLEMCERYAKLYGGPIYDALEAAHLPNQVLHKSIKPLAPGMVLAGAALPCKAIRRPAREDVPPGPDLVGAVYPGSVIVYDASDEEESGHFGELTGNSCASRGCRGVVVDGGLRDSAVHLRIPNWSCFSKYTSPIELAGRQSIVEAGKPVFMPGSLTSVVRVNPGDFVFGDLDGVIIIPKDLAPDILLKAEDTVAREAMGRAELWKGLSMHEIGEKYHVG